jgi:diacylglycerol O-acyltransferase
MPRTARMSGIDAAWLRMDRPTNPMVIVAVTILDGRCTRAAFRRLLGARLLRFPRFRCRPVADALGGTWVPDDRFSLDAHVVEQTLPRGSTQADVERIVGELAGTRLDETRPRWRFDLLQRPGHGTTVVMRIHHCYADGIALVRTYLGMTAASPESPPSDDAAHAVGDTVPEVASGPARRTADRRGGAQPTATASAFDAWGEFGDVATALGAAALRGAQDTWAAALRAIVHPMDTATALRRGLDELGGVGGALASLLALPDDPPTPLRGALGTSRGVAWAPPLRLPEVRAIAHALDCTINDVLLSVVAGALGRHLIARGVDVTGLTLRGAIPVNLRPPSEPVRLGNRFGLVLVDLPVGLVHPLDRLYAVRASMRALKGSRQPAATYTVLNALGAAHPAVESLAIDVLSRKASAVVSNVPGPRSPLYLCGRRIEQMYFWVPQSGSIGIGVSILSYVDDVLFGLVADAGLVPHPHEALDGVAAEFERLVKLTLLGASAVDAGDRNPRRKRRTRAKTRGVGER